MQADYDRLNRNELNLGIDVESLEQKIIGLEKRLNEQKAKAKNAAKDETAYAKAREEAERLSEGIF